eukprot:TRINITY_DN11542_c0_g1_i1.p1 TRINITY_DN11542_c0_g1~~TRINITY_DN11542_c0_g1_i1.p1  ORF type:complete len:295 (+),score=65.99 TRINITY_DN11542_c0_g1_i1:114-998(+)
MAPSCYSASVQLHKFAHRLLSATPRPVRCAASVASVWRPSVGVRRAAMSTHASEDGAQPRPFPSKSAVDRPGLGVEKVWFPTSDALAGRVEAAKKRGTPLFVFLEGPAGSGKTELLRRLERLGYRTIAVPFVEHAAQHPPGRLRALRWASEMLRQLDEIVRSNKEAPVKDAVVFVARSPLSTEVYAPGDLPDVMADMRQVFDCAVILCHAEPVILLQRIAGRYELSPHEQKDVRSRLGEPDDVAQQSIAWDRYGQLEAKGSFDAVLPTTSTKQATAGILRLLGLGFKWTPPTPS